MDPVGSERPLLLITGSSGLLGAALSDAFAGEYRVVGLDVKEPERVPPGAEFQRCDLTDDADVRRALTGIRDHHGSRIASVLHLAAYYDFSGAPSPLYHDLTVEGTRRLVRTLRDFDVEQLVFSSSLLVMEPVDVQPQREVLTEEAPTRAEWPYPQSKLDAEAVLREEHGGLPVVILRIAGVYTAECRSIPIADHMRRIYEKQLESYFFPGKKDHGQPFVHLDDLVECFRQAVARRASLDDWELFLIAEPETLSFADLQETLGELIYSKSWPALRVPKPVAKAGAWVKDKLSGGEAFIKPWMISMADDHYPVEIQRARERLGWQPKHRLRADLQPMVELLLRDPRRFYEVNGLTPPAKQEA